MPSTPQDRRAHSELDRQIAAAKDSAASLSATFTLKSPAHKEVLSPDETREAVRNIVARVEREVAARAHDVNVFPYLQSFAVQAPAAVVERLAAQPEIASAMPSKPSEDVMIRPVERKEVPAPAPATPVPSRPKRKRTPPKG